MWRILGTREFIREVVPVVEGIVSSATIAGFGKAMAVRTNQCVDRVMRGAEPLGMKQ